MVCAVGRTVFCYGFKYSNISCSLSLLIWDALHLDECKHNTWIKFKKEEEEEEEGGRKGGVGGGGGAIKNNNVGSYVDPDFFCYIFILHPVCVCC